MNQIVTHHGKKYRVENDDRIVNWGAMRSIPIDDEENEESLAQSWELSGS